MARLEKGIRVTFHMIGGRKAETEIADEDFIEFMELVIDSRSNWFGITRENGMSGQKVQKRNVTDVAWEAFDWEAEEDS